VARLNLVLTASVLVASCSSHAPMTPLVAAPPANPSTIAPRADAAQASTASAPGATGPAPNKDLINRGYHFRMINGQAVYCRSQPVTGSNLKSTVCQTEAQIVADQQNAQDLLRQVQSQPCANTPGASCLHY
jgi:hypothetical protein